MKRTLVLGALLLPLVLVTAAARAHGPATGLTPAAGVAIDAAFRRGNDAYYRGEFKAAIDAYEQVAALGVVHEDLYYNLGNAYYKAGRMGPAIFNFERALALDPDQTDARRNLGAARQAAERFGKDRVEGKLKDAFWVRAVTSMTRAHLLWLFLGVYYLCFVVLIVLRWLPPSLVRAAVATSAVFLALAAALAGTLFFGRLAYERLVHVAVVLPDEVAVKDGPGPGSRTAFDLHAGLNVWVIEQDQDWVRVRLQNGLEGWMRDADLGRL
jgi:tetratricopeptide (TPR) repeat protein